MIVRVVRVYKYDISDHFFFSTFDLSFVVCSGDAILVFLLIRSMPSSTFSFLSSAFLLFSFENKRVLVLLYNSLFLTLPYKQFDQLFGSSYFSA